MSVAAVAKKDFRDGVRSRLLWALTAMFVLSIGGFSLLATQSSVEDGGTVALIGMLGISSLIAVVVLVPLTGLVVSIKSVVRERELGSIKILLSLPHTRGEVVAGKFIGRVGLLTTAILSGFLPAGIIFALRIDNFPLFEYVALVLVTILFGVTFVAVGLGISALTRTETRATIGGVAAFFLLYSWQSIFNWINGQLELFSGDALLFVQRFDLFTVFYDVFAAIMTVQHDDIPNASLVAVNQQMMEDPSASEVASQPIYLQHWFAFVILGAWIAVPLMIGYYRFKATDL